MGQGASGQFSAVDSGGGDGGGGADVLAPVRGGQRGAVERATLQIHHFRLGQVAKKRNK